MEEQLRLANEDRVSGFQDISLFMATDLTFRFSLYNWAQLFEGRLALNPELNLTLVSFSSVQKHFLG